MLILAQISQLIMIFIENIPQSGVKAIKFRLPRSQNKHFVQEIETLYIETGLKFER